MTNDDEIDRSHRRNLVAAPLSLAELAAVCGGMKWEDFRPSENVEDRRGLSPRESMRVRPQMPPPLPPLQRTPGDLSSQAGLDDIKRRRR
jgi:hypothetical protein